VKTTQLYRLPQMQKRYRKKLEISAHFRMESVENLVANRRNRFINRYGETDNYLCQMVR